MAELSEALKEAYASNPVGQVIVETLEFRHPSFVDGNGNPAAFRIVNQFEDVFATLEATTPLQPGQTVQFVAFAFSVQLPGFEEGQAPTLKITVDNVGRELMEQLELATASQAPIEVTYRPYLLEGDRRVRRVGRVRGLPALARDRGLAWQQGRVDQHHRLRRHGLQPVLRQPGERRPALVRGRQLSRSDPFGQVLVQRLPRVPRPRHAELRGEPQDRAYVLG